MFRGAGNFYIAGGDSAFSQRQRDVFQELDRVEKAHPTNRYTEEEFKAAESKRRVFPKNDMKQFQGKESIFKRPEAPIPKVSWKRKVPDYQINPHKWTKYSLEDVKLESDESNTNTALAFLKELSDRLIQPPETEEEADGGIKFKKPSRLPQNEPRSNKPKFIDGTYTMPEYAVGQKVSKSNKQRKVESTSTAEDTTRPALKLHHLLEDEDESDN